MESSSLSPLLSYVDVGCQILQMEVILLYFKSREESLFPDISKHHEGFSNKGLRTAEELNLACQKRRAGRLQRVGRGEEELQAAVNL